MELTEETQAMIDGMNYYALLKYWRFAKLGDPLMQGDSGHYFSLVLSNRRAALPDGDHAKISKAIGWEKEMEN